MKRFAMALVLMCVFSGILDAKDCLLLSHTLCGTVTNKPVIAMFTADVITKTVDTRQTERDYHTGYFIEHDSFIRPLLNHPTAYYSYEYAYALTAAWMGNRMSHSQHHWIRRLWWIPQSVSISQAIYGYVYTKENFHIRK